MSGIMVWTHVKDGLPKVDEEYNVAWKLDDGEMVTTTMEYINGRWIDTRLRGESSDSTDEVFYWMPLPKPPKH